MVPLLLRGVRISRIVLVRSILNVAVGLTHQNSKTWKNGVLVTDFHLRVFKCHTPRGAGSSFDPAQVRGKRRHPIQTISTLFPDNLKPPLIATIQLVKLYVRAKNGRQNVMRTVAHPVSPRRSRPRCTHTFTLPTPRCQLPLPRPTDLAATHSLQNFATSL